MNVPLYQNAQLPKDAKDAKDASNVGLVFDKYFAGWSKAFLDEPVGDCGNGRVEKFGTETKPKWVECISKRGAKASPGDAAKRQAELVRKLGGEIWFVTAISRFVTGTGIANPLENGFAFHHTLGVPYLAASGLKGAIRNYWVQWHNPKSENDDIPRLLGSAESGVGSVIFFDMLPVAPVKFAAEVMTPHYGEWYQDRAVPGDWISPTPIPFIVVEAGAIFQIAVAPRKPGNSEWMAKNRAELKNIIVNALDITGIGAKTAVGNGRFVLSNTEAEAKTALNPNSAGPRTDRRQDATPRYNSGDVLPANTKLTWDAAGCEVKTVEPVTLKPGIEIKVLFDDGEDDHALISGIRQLKHIN